MKIGVIGLGKMGVQHAAIAREFKATREVLGCEVLPQARARAKRLGIASVGELSALLAWKPDAVLVATHASGHTAVIEPCLSAGIPVFTEKPLATTLADCRRLVALAARKKVQLQVGFELRFCGMTRAIKDILGSGLVGKPLNLSLVQISGPHTPQEWQLKRVGGIFWEKLCHQVDYYRFWLGEPKRIMAIAGAKALKYTDLPDSVTSCMEFPGGRMGTITFMTTRSAQVGGTSDHGDRGHFYELCMTCTKGSLTACAWTETLSVVRFNHRKDCRNELVDRFIIRDRYGEPSYDLRSEDFDFLQCVHDGRKLHFTAEDALQSMEWVAKGERSLAQNGKWIS